ncbi:unnamed protein product [Cylicostephanus goldi]|uniref:Uncharacterized protein n=1 Tax=Cylicostephanus goldi TaxID=71465 RepID=A0A3P7Q9C9_CYLGO|nr:unnamed protein product [Cylicostephanus goldi]
MSEVRNTKMHWPTKFASWEKSNARKRKRGIH